MHRISYTQFQPMAVDVEPGQMLLLVETEAAWGCQRLDGDGLGAAEGELQMVVAEAHHGEHAADGEVGCGGLALRHHHLEFSVHGCDLICIITCCQSICI